MAHSIRGRRPNRNQCQSCQASKNDSAAVAARKLERDRAQKWKVEVSKATRCINSLNSVCLSLTNTMVRCKKNPEKFPGDLITSLEQAEANTRELKHSNLPIFPNG